MPSEIVSGTSVRSGAAGSRRGGFSGPPGSVGSQSEAGLGLPGSVIRTDAVVSGPAVRVAVTPVIPDTVTAVEPVRP